MRSRWTNIPLVLFASFAAACARGPSSAPIATVVAAKVAGGAVVEKAADDAAAEPDDGDDDDTDYVSPCKARSFALHSGELALSAFDAKVNALPIAGDPHPLMEDLEKLLEHPCFELAASDPKDELAFDSGFALRRWWREGGRDWLDSYLHLDDRRSIRVPPTPRVSLTRETAPKDHPLLPLLCPADETIPCGSETAGWMRRTEQTLSLVAEANRRASPGEKCEEEARKQPAGERYASFRDCIEQASNRERALPIGRFKAPSDGWFVILDDDRGCHWLRAYDLASGSTYSVHDCNGGKVEIESGRVPVAALREAAWMMMLAPATQGGVHRSSGHLVPDDFPIKRARGESSGFGMSGCSCGPTERNTWSWMREKNGVLRGQASGVVIGRGDDEAVTHAFDLLDVAADAFAKGCAPSPPPARIAWSAPGAAVKDGQAAVLDAPESASLRLALAKATPSSRACAKTP